jgi:hypothetical protein
MEIVKIHNYLTTIYLYLIKVLRNQEERNHLIKSIVKGKILTLSSNSSVIPQRKNEIAVSTTCYVIIIIERMKKSQTIQKVHPLHSHRHRLWSPLSVKTVASALPLTVNPDVLVAQPVTAKMRTSQRCQSCPKLQKGIIIIHTTRS